MHTRTETNAVKSSFRIRVVALVVAATVTFTFLDVLASCALPGVAS